MRHGLLLFVALFALLLTGCPQQGGGKKLTREPNEKDLKQFANDAHIEFPESTKGELWVEEENNNKKIIWLRVEIESRDYTDLLRHWPHEEVEGLKLSPVEQYENYQVVWKTEPKTVSVGKKQIDEKKTIEIVLPNIDDMVSAGFGINRIPVFLKLEMPHAQ